MLSNLHGYQAGTCVFLCEALVRSFTDSGGNCLCLVTQEPLKRGSHASRDLMDGVI